MVPTEYLVAMSAAMALRPRPLPEASPAKTFFQPSKPPLLLPHGAACAGPYARPIMAAKRAAKLNHLFVIEYPHVTPTNLLHPVYGLSGEAMPSDIVNLNHFHKKVPLSPEMSVSSRLGDGVPSHHRPRRELNGRSPAPPFGASSFSSRPLRMGRQGFERPEIRARPVLPQRVLTARGLYFRIYEAVFYQRVFP